MPKSNQVAAVNGDELPTTTAAPEEERDAPPKQLPKHLANLKHYADSKLCYFSKPLENGEIISIEPKIAYQCTMKILIETRKLKMVTRSYEWHTERVLGSRSLGIRF